jgi:hypothetical protein
VGLEKSWEKAVVGQLGDKGREKSWGEKRRWERSDLVQVWSFGVARAAKKRKTHKNLIFQCDFRFLSDSLSFIGGKAIGKGKVVGKAWESPKLCCYSSFFIWDIATTTGPSARTFTCRFHFFSS